MLILLSTTIFIKLYQYKVIKDNEDFSELSIKSAAIYIESLSLRDNLEEVQIDDDEKNPYIIFIYKDKFNTNNEHKEKVYFQDGILKISTKSTDVRHLTYKIKDFSIKEKEDLIYITITDLYNSEEHICVLNRDFFL